MLKLFTELTKNLSELTIDVDEFETVTISGLPDDSDGLVVKGESLEMALQNLVKEYPGRFPVCELLLSGIKPAEDPQKAIALETVKEIGINHPLFGELRFDLDHCIRRGVDEIDEDKVVTIPLKIAIKRSPYSPAAQVSYSICLNVAKKKHATKGKVPDFMAKYDETGHLLALDEQMTIDELPEASQLLDADPDENTAIDDLEQLAIEEPATDPFDDLLEPEAEAEPEPAPEPEQKLGGLIKDIWPSLGVDSAIRLINDQADITVIVIGYIDKPTKRGHEWILRVINEDGDEEQVQQEMIDILIWDDSWYYRELPKTGEEAKA